METTTETIARARPLDNLVIADLARENLQFAERIASLEQDVEIYREMAQAGIHALAKVTKERDTVRRALYVLRRSRQQPQPERWRAA